VQIVVGLPFQTSGTYSWNTLTVPVGSYYIYGTLVEGSGADTQVTAADYSAGTVQITNHLPVVTVTSPSTANEKALDNQYTIRWNVQGLDNRSEALTLYYAPDLNPANRVLITSGINPNVLNNFTWNTGSVPDGTYYIYAVVTDPLDAPAYSSGAYSAGTVLVNNSAVRPLAMTVTQPAAALTLDGTDDQIIYNPSATPEPARGQTLKPFLPSDNIYWYDRGTLNAWNYDASNPGSSANDSMWLDTNSDGGVYDAGDIRLAGAVLDPSLGIQGTFLTRNTLFSYLDINGNSAWNSGEPIVYEGGSGNWRFHYSNSRVTINYAATSGSPAPTLTNIHIYLDTDTNSANGFYQEITSETIIVPQGNSLSGSYTYDFSQIPVAAHGRYYVVVRATDASGW
jgi:hypothetical protein